MSSSSSSSFLPRSFLFDTDCLKIYAFIFARLPSSTASNLYLSILRLDTSPTSIGFTLFRFLKDEASMFSVFSKETKTSRL